MKEGLSRRKFLQSSGIVAAPFIIPHSAWSAVDAILPSNRITLGFIGLGKQGTDLLRGFMQLTDVQIVALCDVDKLKLARAQNLTRNTCTLHGDYRELLQRKDIDAVVIATPDHWHAVQAIQAMRLGKDVYCEKPLSLTIGQARQMVAEARRWDRVVQVGSMQRSDGRFRHACELVQNGYIGEVKKVRVSVRTGFQNHPKYCDLAAEPVPSELDWDLWLGPAPFRPFNAILAPPVTYDGYPAWRDYTDYSGGGMTDWGAHHFDIAQWGLAMDHSGPVEIIPPDGSEFPYLTYRYRNGVEMTADFEDNLIRFIGTQGIVEVNRSYLKTVPENLANVKLPPTGKHLYASAHHLLDWIHCVRTRTRPATDIEIGCRSVTVCHLGNLAVQLNRTLHWDPVTEKFSEPEGNRLLTRSMRSPWEI